MKKLLTLILGCLFSLPLFAAPGITVSASAVDILGNSTPISISVKLIDPNNTGNLRVSGTGVIPIFTASTVTPGTTATVGPIYGNDVILDGFGNLNGTYYLVQVFTVTNSIIASTPSLQNFYAFTGSGTVDLATATPLAPSFMSGANGSVVIPGTLATFQGGSIAQKYSINAPGMSSWYLDRVTSPSNPLEYVFAVSVHCQDSATYNTTPNNPTPDYNVAIFATINRSGSQNCFIWAENPVVQYSNAGAAQIIEGDMYNNYQDFAVGGADTNAYVGTAMSSEGTFKPDVAFLVTKGGSAAKWQRGVVVNQAAQRALEVDNNPTWHYYSDDESHFFSGLGWDFNGPSTGMMRLTPSDDLTPTGTMFLITNHANTTSPFNIEKNGQVNATAMGVVNASNAFNLLISNSAPAIASGFGTSPSVVGSNGTAAFQINVGTGGTATNGVITLPTATTGWWCKFDDITTQSSTVFITKQIGSSASSATIANFNTSGAQAAWVASDKLNGGCFAY